MVVTLAGSEQSGDDDRTGNAPSNNKEKLRLPASLLNAFIIVVIVALSLPRNLSTYLPDTSIVFDTIGLSNGGSTGSDASWYHYDESDDKSIRKWGCNRSETPLIFVHIGKVGRAGYDIYTSLQAFFCLTLEKGWRRSSPSSICSSGSQCHANKLEAFRSSLLSDCRK